MCIRFSGIILGQIGLFLGAIGWTQGAMGEDQKLVSALAFKPRQEGVRIEEVPADKIKDCKIEEITRPEGKGFHVTGPGGQTLRWFVDTSGDGRKLDRWCYYFDGVEVYRESDTNNDDQPDEFRWLGTEGLRWGIDKNKDGKIDDWKMISAEEVSAEAVRAAATRDADRYSRLLLTATELQSLGLSDEKSAVLRQKLSDAKAQFAKWAAGQSVVTRESRWTQFGAEKPGVVPAGTDGSTRDVIVYENVVALLANKGQPQQLLIGTMIQVGSNWRLVDLPRVVSEGAELSDAGIFFSASFSDRGANAEPTVPPGGISKSQERLVDELQQVDNKLQAESVSASDKERLHALRADVLEKLIAAASTPEDRTTWIKQFADTVNAAAQTREYPAGVERLVSLTTKLATVDVTKDDVAYISFRAITAEYTRNMQAPDANFQEEQKSYLEKLEKFVREFPTSADAAEGMIQIALSAELAGDPKTATRWYEDTRKGFADTLPGKKAAGAITRLGLAGTKFALKGKTLDGRAFDSKDFAKEPIVFHYWASWCEPCKAEMRALKELQAKYAKQKLRIVGINLDNQPATAQAFLKANPYPWIHLYDAGGLDGNLAVELGVLTLPVNVVVDSKGVVVKSGVHWSELDGVLQKLMR